MFKNVILTLGLSAAILAPNPALAIDEIIPDYQPSQVASVVLEEPVVLLPLKTRAYNAVESAGLVDMGKGTVSLAKGAGRVVKDAMHVGLATGSVAMAAGHLLLYPLNYAYAGADVAGNNWQSVKDYASSAYDNVKKAASDMPNNYMNTKDGLTDLYQGGKKLVATAYDGVQAAAQSNVLQSAWSKVKGWFSNAYTTASAASSKVVRAVSPYTFEGVDFS